MSKVLARVKELMVAAMKLGNENAQLVEATNKQLERLDKARENVLQMSTKRQQEILSGLSSRKGAIFELLKLELGDDATAEAIESKSLELQKEIAAELEAKKAEKAKAKEGEQKSEEKASAKPLEMIKPTAAPEADLKN